MGFFVEIRYLKEFMVLANLLNFTTAANQLYMTQPTLSKHITILESELGTPLFFRSKKEVSLTAAGELLLKSSAKIIHIYEQTLNDIALSSRGSLGTLRIGMLYYGFEELVAPVIREMSHNFPQISVLLTSCQPKANLESLQNDKIDIIEYFDIPFPNREDLFIQPTISQSFSVLLPSTHPLAMCSSVTPEEIKHENFVFPQEEPHLNQFKKSLLARHGITIQKEYMTQHIDTVSMAVEQYQAAALVLSHAVKFREGNQNVVSIPIHSQDFQVDMIYAWKKSNRNPSIASFLETLKNVF